jgi:hypothetical protein
MENDEDVIVCELDKSGVFVPVKKEKRQAEHKDERPVRRKKERTHAENDPLERLDMMIFQSPSFTASMQAHPQAAKFLDGFQVGVHILKELNKMLKGFER